MEAPSPTAPRRRKHWGWGYEHEQPPVAEVAQQAAAISSHLGFGCAEVQEPVPIERVRLPARRVNPPSELAPICAHDDHARACHALGKSYKDVVMGFRGRFEHPPDFVAMPRHEQDVQALLQWCQQEHVAAIPYGGGTSVVGGVEARVPESCNGAISIDTSALAGALQVDEVSRAALIGAGTSGPALEAALAQHGLTLRHFPQSFELSTLGGWIATRAGGHFATLWTHIDDLVESITAITPSGRWESRRLPGSGAGPSPDRMLLGSEGTLGLITQAWVRVQPRPDRRVAAAVRFEDFMRGAECVRAISQSGLHPANCRLIDPLEAALTGTGDGRAAVLLLGFESFDHEVEAAIDRALAICREHHGEWDAVSATKPAVPGKGRGWGGADDQGEAHPAGGGPAGSHPQNAARAGTVGRWREAFLRAPYLRDTFVAMGIISETFETAITWDRFHSLHARVTDVAGAAIEEVTGARRGAERGQAHVTCRFTHVYPDGPALYFTVLAPGRRGEEIEQWDEIKRRVSEAIDAEGATITHHHAVGRDHRPWYDSQRPDPFAIALRGAKAAVDPCGIMNPGVLIDPASASGRTGEAG